MQVVLEAIGRNARLEAAGPPERVRRRAITLVPSRGDARARGHAVACGGPMAELFRQRDQPPGVPPLALDGERTLPDVPEENYWFRRHLVVYEWIAARVAGLRVVDLASGEGYGSDTLARAAAWVVGVEANPEAFEHARLRYGGRTCASRATWSSASPSRATRSCSCRRSSTSPIPAPSSSTSRGCCRRAARPTSRRRTS